MVPVNTIGFEGHHQLYIGRGADQVVVRNSGALYAVNALWRTAIGNEIGKIRARAGQLPEYQ